MRPYTAFQLRNRYDAVVGRDTWRRQNIDEVGKTGNSKSCRRSPRKRNAIFARCRGGGPLKVVGPGKPRSHVSPPAHEKPLSGKGGATGKTFAWPCTSKMLMFTLQSGLITTNYLSPYPVIITDILRFYARIRVLILIFVQMSSVACEKIPICIYKLCYRYPNVIAI